MRLPPATAHFSQPVTFGGYLGRRLRRAQYKTMAADVATATSTLLLAGRAWEDSEGPIQDALADRDAIDDDLDSAAQDARAALAGRSATAVKEAPYTMIFPDGVTYYTAAPLDEETKRYGELKARLVDNLPPGDDVRVKTVAVIDPNVKAFAEAVAALDQARTAQAMARTKLDAAREAWDRQMEKVYGALVAEFGKAKAERFFPAVRVKKAEKPTG
ncbi:MAG: hypothetical protein QM820_47265 [Minicystis sp.]